MFAVNVFRQNVVNKIQLRASLYTYNKLTAELSLLNALKKVEARRYGIYIQYCCSDVGPVGSVQVV